MLRLDNSCANALRMKCNDVPRIKRDVVLLVEWRGDECRLNCCCCNAGRMECHESRMVS